MGSQRGAKEYEYDCQQRGRKRKAEEEGDDRRLHWAGNKRSASPRRRRDVLVVAYSDSRSNRSRL